MVKYMKTISEFKLKKEAEKEDRVRVAGRPNVNILHFVQKRQLREKRERQKNALARLESFDANAPAETWDFYAVCDECYWKKESDPWGDPPIEGKSVAGGAFGRRSFM